MAAPTQGPYGSKALIFDPTMADTNPVGQGWHINFTGSGHSNWKILSNVLAPSNEGSAAQAWRQVAKNGIIDCEFWCEIPAKATTNGHYLDLCPYLRDPNSSTRDFYYLELTLAVGADTWDVGGQKNAVGTGALASGTQEITAGDYVAVAVRDNGSGSPIISGWYWALAGSSWTQIVTYTDTAGDKIIAPGLFAIEATVNSAWRVGKIYGDSQGVVVSDRTAFPKQKLREG